MSTSGELSSGSAAAAFGLTEDVPGQVLSDLVAPKHTALLLQEMQRGILGPQSMLPALVDAGERVGLIDHAVVVVNAARAAGVAVIHCTAENLPGGFGANRNSRLFAGTRDAGVDILHGNESVEPIREVGPEPGDIVLPRYHGLSPLSGSSLDQLLRNDEIQTVVIVGVSLNLAVPNMVFDAINHSYRVVVVTDAVAGVPLEYGKQVLVESLALVATLTTAAELAACWRRPTPTTPG